MANATGALSVVGGPPRRHEENHISEPRINDRIRVPEVRLVGPNGEQVGIVRIEQALTLAAESDLDLVEVAPQARPPVCKLMDFGKWKYESDMKAREARRNQAHTVLKEIRLRLKIDPHDYATKRGHVERFLKAGDKVKVMIMFRGREQSRPELGDRLLQRMAADVAELGFVESSPTRDGRNMIMVIGPHKKKGEARAEQQQQQRSRRRDEAPVEQVELPAEPLTGDDGPGAVPAAVTAPPAAAAPAAAEPVAAPTAAEPVAATEPTTSRPAAAPRPPATPRPTAAPRPSAAPKPAAAPRPSATPRPAAAPKPAGPTAGPRAAAKKVAEPVGEGAGEAEA